MSNSPYFTGTGNNQVDKYSDLGWKRHHQFELRSMPAGPLPASRCYCNSHS
jgi:hypothetical protein